jgi:hypothetical protein
MQRHPREQEQVSLVRDEQQQQHQQHVIVLVLVSLTHTHTPSTQPAGKRFAHSMDKLFAGASRVNRDEFMQQFDLGVPPDATTPGNQEALILYHSPKSLPDASMEATVAGGPLPQLSVQDATLHCDTLKIILTEPSRPKQCMAIVGQWESYNIHKYMRLPPDNIRTGIDSTLPLRNVARTHSANKGKSQVIPKTFNVEAYDQGVLAPYLTALKGTLARLKPVAVKVAKDNTIVVLVCNLGQSELLVNFICNARSKKFDLSQILVFATDVETQKIAEALGVATFYDEVVRQSGNDVFCLVSFFCQQPKNSPLSFSIPRFSTKCPNKRLDDMVMVNSPE